MDKWKEIQLNPQDKILTENKYRSIISVKG
jgi:hypothetical protein